jgi:hypothetical protein
MDQVATTTAAASPLASSQVTETYHWGGRQRAQFDADQDAQAKATGTDKIQLGFKDVLDLINPLQHIPIVSNIYQAVSGDDTIKPAIKTSGDIIYGGPLGGLSSVADDIFKQASGKDIVSTLASWAGIGSDAPVQTASSGAANAAASTSQGLGSSTPIEVSALGAVKPTTVAAAAPLSATANTTAPANSQLFKNLQRGAAPQGQVLAASQPKYFNPTAKQFAGITPASFHPSKDIANTNASIGLQANMQTNDITQAAAQSSNAAIASGLAQQANKSGDTVQAPQSDFAQKMLSAMDRYEASKKAGDATSAPTVSQGL